MSINDFQQFRKHIGIEVKFSISYLHYTNCRERKRKNQQLNSEETPKTGNLSSVS